MQPGTIVQVVKRTLCCNSDYDVGEIHVVANDPAPSLHHEWGGPCFGCGHVHVFNPQVYVSLAGSLMVEKSRVKKYDPPAEGETREAYKNLKVPA